MGEEKNAAKPEDQRLVTLGCLVPDAMAALAGEYKEDHDFNHRARVRMKIKALLDFLGADTKYPDVPQATQPERNRDGYLYGDGVQPEGGRRPVPDVDMQQNEAIIGGERA